MSNSPQYYSWRGYRCAYTVDSLDKPLTNTPALVLIHPIGVGLSGIFWQRFIATWLAQNPDSVVYNPDLLGCGASDMPAVAYYPVDWAQQIQHFIATIVKKPVILVVQGASFPIAINLVQKSAEANEIKGLVLSAPPAWRTITDKAKPQQQKLLWNLLFNSPVGLGQLFYRYARRRQFIESFSIRQLFAKAEQVDDHWLDELTAGAKNPQSRYAVFSFLAGFWREDYASAISQIEQPTLVVFGEQSSSISREGKSETLQERLDAYLKHLPQGQGCFIPGRNVLPYESTSEFVRVVADFIQQS
ncbi:alpha/beta fold hydrolase [Pleurocapsa sp. PCC 7319]|uniref:alpha/beta fold hydrolase n=1 Tax=Pleurocapsa sp. PCC 7319 TaxID=118161 RepID=UPI0003694B67